MTDVTPTAGRLLRTPRRPEPKNLGLQRGPVSVPASGRCSHGAATAAVHALHCCSSSTPAPEAIAPISLELEAWPSEPSTPSTSTTSSECDSTSPTSIPSLRQRFSYSPLGRLRGHTRANSLDSTTTDASIASSSSISSTRSRWNIFAPVLDELTASNHRSDYASDKKSRQAREVWREYW